MLISLLQNLDNEWVGFWVLLLLFFKTRMLIFPTNQNLFDIFLGPVNKLYIWEFCFLCVSLILKSH